MAQTFNKEFYYVSYYMDSATYAKNCVNKARPLLHCNGKCQLAKKIREQEKKDQENQEHRYEYKVQVLSSRSSFAQEILHASVIPHAFQSDRNTGTPVDRPGFVFHPPGTGSLS